MQLNNNAIKTDGPEYRHCKACGKRITKQYFDENDGLCLQCSYKEQTGKNMLKRSSNDHKLDSLSPAPHPAGNLAGGLIMIVLGVILTMISYSSSEGGSYILFIGLILGGIITMAKGR